MCKRQFNGTISSQSLPSHTSYAVSPDIEPFLQNIHKQTKAPLLKNSQTIFGENSELRPSILPKTFFLPVCAMWLSKCLVHSTLFILLKLDGNSILVLILCFIVRCTVLVFNFVHDICVIQNDINDLVLMSHEIL